MTASPLPRRDPTPWSDDFADGVKDPVRWQVSPLTINRWTETNGRFERTVSPTLDPVADRHAIGLLGSRDRWRFRFAWTQDHALLVDGDAFKTGVSMTHEGGVVRELWARTQQSFPGIVGYSYEYGPIVGVYQSVARAVAQATTSTLELELDRSTGLFIAREIVGATSTTLFIEVEANIGRIAGLDFMGVRVSGDKMAMRIDDVRLDVYEPIVGSILDQDFLFGTPLRDPELLAILDDVKLGGTKIVVA